MTGRTTQGAPVPFPLATAAAHAALAHVRDSVVIAAAEAPHPIIYVNDAFCRSTGYAADELTGQPLGILVGAQGMPPGLGSPGYRHDTARLAATCKDGSPCTLELCGGAGGPDGADHLVLIRRDSTGVDVADDPEHTDAFATLFQDHPLPMFIYDRDTLGVIRVNDAAVALYGWSRAEFMAMTLRELRNPEDWPTLEANTRAGSIAMADQAVWAHRRADGSMVHVHGALMPYPAFGDGALLAIVWDVTEMQLTREHLRRNLTQLRIVSEQLRTARDELTEATRLAQLGSWRLSKDLQKMSWSDGIYTLIGRKRSEFHSSFDNLLQVVHPEDRSLFEQANQTAAAGGELRDIEARILRADGRERRVRVAFRQNAGAASDAGLFGYCQDITERWETQQALMRSERLAILGHLTGGVAHDFNNLLTVVTLNLEEAIDTLPETDDLQAILVPALQAAQRGADLTNQLLAYARQAPLRPQAVRLATLLTTFSPLIRRALGKEHELRIQIDDERCTPLVDPPQLQTALLNLALNARESMPAGGEVVIAAGRVTLPQAAYPIEGHARGAYAMITVTDQGCGIEADVLPHIFEPFFTTKESSVGSGLGLSMVDGFIGQSGGHILVESQVGKGTTVRLFLPLSEEQRAEPSRGEDRQSRRALLVEDQPAVLATVGRMFKQLGYEVCGVLNAEAALAELDNRTDYAILFTDIILQPGMDGIALAKEVQRRAPHIRVLLTSGFSEHNRSPSTLPSVEILMKPYKRQDLLDRLNAIMARDPG